MGFLRVCVLIIIGGSWIAGCTPAINEGLAHANPAPTAICPPTQTPGICKSGEGDGAPSPAASQAAGPVFLPSPSLTEPVVTSTLPPTTKALPTRAPTNTIQPATALLPENPWPTPCLAEVCTYSNLVLQRPIAPPGNNHVERSYSFGSTQGGQRDPHHGVEFINPLGVPVLAAADGVVTVAGDDRNKLYGPYWYFYGNLVILEHTLPGQIESLYTLYGHLSQIKVKEGQRLQAGQQIGQVGMTGIATGTHLHFEVRVGENSYKNSRNPEMWLAPAVDESQPTGALAGRIEDGYGNLLQVPSIVIEHLPAPDQPSDLRFYTSTYEEKSLLGHPPFGETFALGDLPPGWYRISFVQYGMQQRLVQVKPGELTFISFRLGES